MSYVRHLLIVTGLAAGVLFGAPAAQAGPIFSDPTGDTFNPGPDLTGVRGQLIGPSVVFTLQFTSPVDAPSSFTANSLTGYIDIDRDMNTATTSGNAPWGIDPPGGNSWINHFVSPNGGSAVPGPPIGLGDEFFIDLASEMNYGDQATVDVFDLFSNIPVGTGSVSGYGTSTVTIVLPQSLLGLGASNDVNFGVLVGNGNHELTDRAPNGALAATTLPEPTSLAVCALSALGAFGYLRYRRKAG